MAIGESCDNQGGIARSEQMTSRSSVDGATMNPVRLGLTFERVPLAERERRKPA
jgi:hypothetical protein